MLKEFIDLHRQGRLDEAEQGYRARLSDHPDDVDALHMLGLLCHQRGDNEEGLALLERARTLAPADASIEATLAGVYFRRGDHAAAKHAYQHALALNPNIGGVHSGLGQIAMMQRELGVAEQHFRTALRAGDDALALAGLGALTLERGEVDSALGFLTRAAALAPEDALVQTMLGQAFAQRGTLAFAEQAFANALRLQPHLHQVRLMLAEILVKSERAGEADPHYRELLGVPGFGFQVSSGLGDAAVAQGRLDDAATHYRAALAIDPRQPLMVRALGWVLAQLDRHEESITAYDDYLAYVPDDRSVRAARADMLLTLGRLREASVDWQAISRADPGDVQAHGRLASIEESFGRWDSADSAAALALSLQPDDTDMLFLRARSCIRRDDDAAALEALERLRRQPLNDAQTRLRWNYLGRLHDRAGEAAAAVRCFTEAQRDLPSSLPALDDPRSEDLLAPPAAAADASAPVLLLGTPGSGVELVAALLAQQPQLRVLRDHFGAVTRVEDFDRARFGVPGAALGPHDRDALRERYLAPLQATEKGAARILVDWLPQWDARLLHWIRSAMPGVRMLLVERDPRDALLNWLAFGWAQDFPCPDPDTAALWLQRARRHLQLGTGFDASQRLAIDADRAWDDAAAAAELARFLGIEMLSRDAASNPAALFRNGLPTRFAAGHWQRYGEALAGPFRHLVP
ncbi:MAG TPA: tetratricopeptide repeat protein [Dokdonella sp.]